MNMEQPAMKYSLRFLINGISDFLVYRVKKEDSERLRSILAQPESKICNSPFFVFSTEDGLSVALSVPDIHIANFLWDPVRFPYRQSREEPEGAPVKIHFRGRPQPFQTGAAEPQELGRLFFYLDTIDLREEPFLYFDDEDGETVALHSNQVVLLTAPSQFVEYPFPDEE
jgi:hypothetical protein